MRHGSVSVVSVALCLVACNAILGIEEPEHRTGDAGSSGGTSGGTGGGGAGGTGGAAGGGGVAGSGGTTSGGAAGSGAAAGDSGTDAPACTESLTTLKADSLIDSAQCSGSISNGGGKYGNVGSNGRALLRFELGAAAAAALQSGAVKGMKLTLHRSVDCEGDCMNGLAVTGTFQVFPLRNDWVEKTAAATYSGADYCRRTDGNPGSNWQVKGAEGAADRGGPAGALTIDAATNTAVFDLDPAQWKSWVANNEVSLLVERQGTTGTFVYATRESTTYAPPTLVVCK